MTYYGRVTAEGETMGYTSTVVTIVLQGQNGQPTGSMFDVAYVMRGVKNESQRPITFFYSGRPGSSSIWLHIGVFGLQRR